MLTKTLNGLSVDGRLDVLQVVARLGVVDRKDILSSLGMETEMQSPDWQKVRRHLSWLVNQNLVSVSEGENGRKLYSFVQIRWNTFLWELQKLI